MSESTKLLRSSVFFHPLGLGEEKNKVEKRSQSQNKKIKHTIQVSLA
jgi:hypothetical protein